MKTKDIQETVTNKLTSLMNEGVNPFQQCWKGVRENGLPFNLNSKRAYSGTNVALLLLQATPCNAWVTYKGAGELGGNVKKGAKSTLVIYWKFLKIKDKVTKEEKTVPMLKSYRVFNALRDCEGLEHLVEGMKPEDILPSQPETALQDYVNREGITLNHGGNRAFYQPSADLVQMPHEQAFFSRDQYQGVLAHELIHSTGINKRLNRKGLTEKAAFGSTSYAFEELVAEFGACITCAMLAIEPDWNNSAAYLKGWSKKLTENPNWAVSASGKAGKATNFILGIA